MGLLYIEQKPIQNILYHSFTIVEYFLFAAIIYTRIKSKKFRKYIVVLSILFFAFCAAYNLFYKVKGIDSIPIGLETILLLSFSFYYLFEQMNDTSTLFIYGKYTFWIILGILLYLSGSFFIYLFSNQLLQEHRDQEVAMYWMFTNIFSFLKNVLFTVAIVINGKPSPTKNTSYQLYHHLN